MSGNLSRLSMGAILLIGLFATMAIAQNPIWNPAGYSPIGGAVPQGPAKCRIPAPPACVPNVTMGCPQNQCSIPYGCPPPMCGPSAKSEPTVYLGYLFRNNGTSVNIEFNNGTVLGVNSTRNEFDLQGIWLELALPFSLSQNTSAFITGAHLFPTNNRSAQTYSFPNGAARRTWDTDVQLWQLNTGLGFRLGTSVSAFGGFRWNSLVVNFDHPSDQQGFVNTNDNAQLTANAYLPFLGLQLNADPSCNSSFSAAVLGFPAAPSDVEYQESLTPTGTVGSRIAGKTDYKSGYFLEALAEASMKMNQWSLGGFARFDLLHTERTRDFTFAQVTRQADITFDRSYWILGGKIAVTF